MNEENNGLNKLGPVDSKPFEVAEQPSGQVFSVAESPVGGPSVINQPNGEMFTDNMAPMQNNDMMVNGQNEEMFANTGMVQDNAVNIVMNNQQVNDNGALFNETSVDEIPLPKLPSIPPGTIEEINNNYQIEQTQIANVEAATKDMDSSYKIITILYFALLGSAFLDLLLAILLTSGNIVLQIIIDILIVVVSILGVIFSMKKNKNIVKVSIAAFIVALLSFGIPLLVGLAIAIFGFKIFNDLKVI